MIGFRVGEASAPGFIQSFLTSIRRFFTRIAAVSVWGVRGRLVVISLTVIAIVSFAFGTLSNLIVTRWIYDDFRRQAFIFGYEISATVSNRQEFEARDNLEGDLNRIMTVRTDVLQMDILRFSASGTNIIATSNPSGRLPFLRRDIDVVRAGRHVSLFVNRPGPRTWAIMVPIIIDGAVMGGLSTRFSLNSAETLISRIRWWTLGLTGLSVAIMGLLMAGAVTYAVNRPIGAFLNMIERIGGGETGVRVNPGGGLEFLALAGHFNEMIARGERYNDEVTRRISEATHELDERLQEVQRLNTLLFNTRRTLIHAERLAVAGQMVAQVAHEVGTPLHSIAGHLELLRGELLAINTEDRAIQRLDIIGGQLTRVETTIRQLLDLTRRDRSPPTPVEITRVIKDSLDLMNPGISAGEITLMLEVEDDLPPVIGNFDQLTQVVRNILANAIDATPPGGIISIHAKPSGNRKVEVSIHDTGPGIPAERQQEIFELFVTDKPAGQGTGLGLFIAAQIIREHNGSLLCESGEGDGSRFRLFLPIVEASA